MLDDPLGIDEALFRIHIESTQKVTAQQRDLSVQQKALANLYQKQLRQLVELKNSEAARSNEFSKLISEMRDIALSKELQEAIGEHLKADIWGALTALMADERFEHAKLQREIAQAQALEIAHAIDELRDAARGAPSLPTLVADAPLLARIKAYPELALTGATRLLFELQPFLVAFLCLLVVVLVHLQLSR